MNTKNDIQLKKYQDLKRRVIGLISAKQIEMYEEGLVYDGILPVKSQSNKLRTGTATKNFENETKSGATYLSNDYRVASDSYAEEMMNNLPFIEFQNNTEVMSDEMTTELNTVFKNIAMASNLNYKMLAVLRRGIRKSFSVAELVPSTITQSGYIMQNGERIKAPDIEQKGFVDLIQYDPFNVYIDTNANPNDVRNTADFIIVDVGWYSKERFDELVKENGWKVPEDEEVLPTDNRNDGIYREVIKQVEGVRSEKGIKISKMFERNGMVTTIANDLIVLKYAINSKMMERMPLIVYTSLPSSETPYGTGLFQTMRQPVLGKSMLINLILDNVGKNLNSKMITRDSKLAGENLNNYPAGSIIRSGTMAGGEKPLSNEYHQLTVPDMTAGSINALNILNTDVQQSSRMNTLSMNGEQGTQIRTNAVLEEMQQNTLKKTSAFIKQAEYTFFQELAKDMIWMFYAFYDDFQELKNIERTIFRDIKSLRIKQGSTLAEDDMSRFQKFLMFLDILYKYQAQSEFDTQKIFDIALSSAGFNVDEYKLPPEEALMKMLIEMGADEQTAMRRTQELMGDIQQEQANV